MIARRAALYERRPGGRITFLRFGLYPFALYPMTASPTRLLELASGTYFKITGQVADTLLAVRES